jgi:peptide/nickel transport system ATP-binding protein
VATVEDLLRIEGLQIRFGSGDGAVRAVRGLDLTVAAGEVVAVVGESGCGKSVSALAVTRLLPPPASATGSIIFDGRNLLELSEREMRAVRGREIAMVFQEPMTSLNPVFTIGDQVSEALRYHEGISRREGRRRAVELLAQVRIATPEERVHAYPHQLSGGMRQRVMIAMALSCNPRLLILDEPTTALDVTTQAEILDIVRAIRSERGTAVLLITHDLGVVADLADRVVVMYAGVPVERASTEELFSAPSHPYTNGLLGALPSRVDGTGDGSRRLAEIPGTVPVLRGDPGCCAFAPRCSRAADDCRRAEPTLSEVGPDHMAACWHPVAAARAGR